MDKLLRRILFQGIGFALMATGWAVSIINVGLDKLTAPSVFTKASVSGFLIILLGAYFPQIAIFILNKLQK